MYPDAELNALAARKAALCQRIGERRARTSATLAELSRPLAWLDRAIALGRQLAPLARAALGPLSLAWAWFRERRAPSASPGRRWGPVFLAGLQLFARWYGRRTG